MKEIKKKAYKKERVVFWVVSAIFMLYALSLILPMLFVLINSFKTNGEFIMDIWAFPKSFNFNNYVYVFKELDIGMMFVWNIVFTLSGTIVGVISGTVVAYILTKYPFKGSGIIFTIFIIFMVIPGIGTMGSSFRLMLDLGFYNSWLGVTIMQASPIGTVFLLLYAYFKNISWSYAEAAFIDGASDSQVFFQIMLPQVMVGIAAVSYLTAIGKWNDYTTPYLYLPSYSTLAVGLQSFSVNASNTGAYTQMFAAMIVSILPILLIFVFFKNYIMNNTVMGGLKG